MVRSIVCASLLFWCLACGNSHNADMPGQTGDGDGDGDGNTEESNDTADASSADAADSDASTDEPDAEVTDPVDPDAGGGEAPEGIAPPEGFVAGAMDECDLNSGWPGDEFCILPPPPDKGFQIHFGPSNYENPEPDYVLQPGEEWVHKFDTTAVNETDIKFYIRQYRMRPGAHHTIVRDTTTGRRLSGANVNQDHPIGGIIAAENAGVGIPLSAHAPITTDHHAINITEEPLLQEVWVNIWYVDPDKVTETTTLLYDPGSVSDTVEPHEDKIMGPYECDIEKPGRLINMFGHDHANNVRFTAWRTRDGHRDTFYEAYHWEEPLWLEFTSLAKNATPNEATSTDGGWTGILDLKAGDKIGWECREINQQDTTLHFTNQTYAGWMCIVIGELVGTSCKSQSGIVFNPNLE